MKDSDFKNTKLFDTIDELLVLDLDAREQLYQMKKTFEEFTRLSRIPDEYYQIKDSYEWITLCFDMKSELRDDLTQHYEYTYFASGICTFEVEFKTPRLLPCKENDVDSGKYERFANEFSSEEVNLTFDDSKEYSDSVIWSGNICVENPEPKTSNISDAYEKLHAAASGLTRAIELEFWSSFDKAQVSLFTKDPFDLDIDLSADYELYEGDTFIGPQAYMRIITELSGEDLVVSKHNNDVVVESTEYFEFSNKKKMHMYRYEPSSSDRYVVNKQVLIDGKKEEYTVGEIRRTTENALCCLLTSNFCNDKEEVIIVSYDRDAIRAFISPNTLIATMKETEDNDVALAFEGTTLMKCKYVVHTEQYYTRYLRLLAAIPYLDFSARVK